MASVKQTQQQTIAETPDDLLNFSSYLNNSKRIGRHRGIPVFIELVDQNGNNVAIPYPPIKNDGEPGRAIIGVRLLVNPASINVNMARIVNRSQTMVSWVEEHWGEEIDTVSIQGSTAAFVLGASDLRYARDQANKDVQNKEAARADFYSSLGLQDQSLITPANSANFLEPGLTTRFRRNTLSYQEFRKLIEVFVTNGVVYDSQGFVAERRFVQISYDYSSYVGYFESIDVTEEATMPFRMMYTISFKSLKTRYSYVTQKGISR